MELTDVELQAVILDAARRVLQGDILTMGANGGAAAAVKDAAAAY